MTALDTWLRQATQRLSRVSAARVRSEIQEHYESVREDSMKEGGATAEEADRLAMTALGDAKAVNCQYRSVLLTSAEARMLREGDWEARAVCSRLWLKWMLLAMPLATLGTALAWFLTGSSEAAQVLLAGGIAMGLMFAAPFLPVYTPGRGRIFRIARCTLLLAVFWVAFQGSWLTFACLWPLAWVEWTRASLRRKLPVARWPKQLYL